MRSSFSLQMPVKDVSNFIHHFTQQEYEAWLLTQKNGEESILTSRQVTSCIFIKNSLHIEVPAKGDAKFLVFGEIDATNAFCTGMDYVKFLNDKAGKEVQNERA